MKIEGINTIPGDPFRVVSAGMGSQAITQASPDREREVTEPQKSLQKEKPSAEEILKNLDEINNQLKSMNRSIRFSIDESVKDIVVKIVDKDSGEVIRQIPPDEVLRLREHFKEMVGLILEKTV
jgi:flagellar protein FlaG